MPLTTVSGIYRAGEIELAEPPPAHIKEARVLVIFLKEADLTPEQSAAGEALRQQAFQQMAE